MAPSTLSLAVCLFPVVCPTDFQGPIELLSFLSPESLSRDFSPIASSLTVEVTYLAVTKDAVKGSSGPLLLPDKAYEDVKDGEQFDIILVPGGMFLQNSIFVPKKDLTFSMMSLTGLGTRPGVIPQAVVDFVKRQAPGAKYILSVCTGSEVLAAAGVLDGLRATTNKSIFAIIAVCLSH